jgi:hypothetical protein
MLYKHENCTDTAIEILKSFYVKEKQVYKWKVMWYNIGKCHAPWRMNIEQNITIKKSDVSNWKIYKYEKQES